MEKTTIEMKHYFSQEEKEALAQELVNRISDKSEVEDQKKESNKRFNDAIKSCNAEISRLSRKISSGSEYRDIEVGVRRNIETKTKEFIDLITGEVVATADFRPEEMQLLIND